MSEIYTGPDAIREYFTGASSVGGSQDKPDLSIGNYRSSTEAMSMAIHIIDGLKGVVIESASGANPTDAVGLLMANKIDTLQWWPSADSGPGDEVQFPINSTATKIVIGLSPSKFLRIRAKAPFNLGTAKVILTKLLGNVFGLDLVPDGHATSGVSQYRATILYNRSSQLIDSLCRWIGELAPSKPADLVVLGSSGAGTIATNGMFTSWPASGWCQIRKADTTLREIVYYSSRTESVLMVPSTGRALLGTSASVGQITDTLHSVPGIAIGVDANGVQGASLPISTIANDTTPPAGVSWNVGITKLTGIIVPSLPANQQVGIWLWRQIPPVAKYSPNVYNTLNTSFLSVG